MMIHYCSLHFVVSQLIYDSSSYDLITLHADKLSAADITKFTKIGLKVPTMM